MKKLILSVAAIAMMLTSCSEKDVAVGPQTTTVKASFGFNESSAKSASTDQMDKSTGGTPIYKQVPCNVRDFSVTAKSGGQDDSDNYFTIYTPTADHSATSTFDLKNIFLGDNTFFTELRLVSSGIPVNTCKQFELLDGDFIEGANTDIDATFDQTSFTSTHYTIVENNEETINLGSFKITNGGAKIIFTGEEDYGTQFNIKPYIVPDGVSAEGSDSPNYMKELEVLESRIVLAANAEIGLVINDASFGDGGERKYIVTADRLGSADQSGRFNQHIQPLSQTKMLTLTKGHCQNLSISIADDFQLTIDVLGGVEISIDDFIIDEKR